MFTFNTEKWIPRFILNDKNGYAIAKAIEAAMQYLNDTVLRDVQRFTDPSKMPEWRMDEFAWEYNILYDYGSDIETKRKWIQQANRMNRIYGTPEAIYQYLGGYFDSLDVEENWVYGASAYHFRVTVEGEWTPENEAWANKAIASAKNVRSVLDTLRSGCKSHIGLSTEGMVLARFSYPMTGAEEWAGRWPQENTVGVLGENDIQAAHADDTYSQIAYKMCGADEI